jgi:hypothetical protein
VIVIHDGYGFGTLHKNLGDGFGFAHHGDGYRSFISGRVYTHLAGGDGFSGTALARGVISKGYPEHLVLRDVEQ